MKNAARAVGRNNSMSMPFEKLRKVIEMAKNAPTEGERSNARRIVERVCVELGITVQNAMAGIFHKGGDSHSFGNPGYHRSPFNNFEGMTDIEIVRRRYADIFQEQNTKMQKAQDDLKTAEERRRKTVDDYRKDAQRRAGR